MLQFRTTTNEFIVLFVEREPTNDQVIKSHLMKTDKEQTENTKLAFSLIFPPVANHFPSLLPSQTSNNCIGMLSTYILSCIIQSIKNPVEENNIWECLDGSVD